MTNFKAYFHCFCALQARKFRFFNKIFDLFCIFLLCLKIVNITSTGAIWKYTIFNEEIQNKMEIRGSGNEQELNFKKITNSF